MGTLIGTSASGLGRGRGRENAVRLKEDITDIR